MPNPIRLCAECKWCVPPVDPQTLHQCQAPRNIDNAEEAEASMLAGDPAPAPSWRVAFCRSHREKGRFTAWAEGYCGARGRWWQPRKS